MHPWLAFLCFIRVLFGKTLPADAVQFLPEGSARPKALPEKTDQKTGGDVPATPPEKPAEKVERKPPALAQHHRDGALALLALLQREGRFVDFVRDTVDGASDGDIGAAAREVHRGCRKVPSPHWDRTRPAWAGVRIRAHRPQRQT